MAEHIILFVEGDTDEVLFKKIIARYNNTSVKIYRAKS